MFQLRGHTKCISVMSQI